MSLWIWAVLLGVFVVDGLLTFGRRLVRRLPPYQAHRSHAYQGAVLRGCSHRAVSASTIVINCLLGGIAVVIWRRPTWAVALVCGSYVVLAGVHWYYSPLRRRKEGTDERAVS